MKSLRVPFRNKRYKKSLHRYKCCDIYVELPVNTEAPVMLSTPAVGQDLEYTPGERTNCDDLFFQYEFSTDNTTRTIIAGDEILASHVGGFIRVTETCHGHSVSSVAIGPVVA